MYIYKQFFNFKCDMYRAALSTYFFDLQGVDLVMVDEGDTLTIRFLSGKNGEIFFNEDRQLLANMPIHNVELVSTRQPKGWVKIALTIKSWYFYKWEG